MAFVTKSACFVFLLFVVVTNLKTFVNGAPLVPCYFIFGDSLADSGNNNNLKTAARVNYPPYGIDFPGGPTGRFTNGRTGVDIIGEFLGFTRFIPPFATASGPAILEGVNYASGSAGILDESGNELGEHVSLNKQLQNHQTTIASLTKLLGGEAAARSHLNKCLYTVGMGSNDYINNYFLPGSKTSRKRSPGQFARILINQYANQLTSLHSAGARKIALIGLGPIGCTPNSMAVNHSNGTCVAKINTAVQLFNNRLKPLVDFLNRKLPGSKFIYVNTWGISQGNPGFKVTNTGCCPVIQDSLCIPNKPPCPNRNEYAFFDDFHPTEAVNKITAARSYKAKFATDAYPLDISRLVLR